MSEEYRPSPPFIVVGAVADGNATAIMSGTVLALNAVGAQLASSQEEHSVTLVSPDAGPVILRCIFDERTESHVGAEIWVSGDLLGGPLWIELEPDEIAERERIREFVRGAFLSSCDRVRPIFAGVGVEWTVVPPRKLESEGVWLPGDLFWSSELDEVDPTLAPDLATIYGRPGRAFSHGALIETGGVLDADAKPPAQPLAAGRAAAKRLARVLAKPISS
jgi:hypothetical protein